MKIMKTNQEKLFDEIKVVMDTLSIEDKKYFAEQLTVEAVNQGSETAYEAIGILEIAKIEYLKNFEEITKVDHSQN